MEGFLVLDSENCGVAGKITGEEKMAKRSSFGSIVRKRLSDITNLQQRPKSPCQDEKGRPISSMDYIDQLHKENMALMKLLADRNKIIELSGLELQKLRINLQKMQQQNWHLAQANSHMLAELNIGKDRLKALHHELGCKDALLKAKNLEQEENTRKKTCPKAVIKEEKAECVEVATESLQANGSNKTCNSNRRRQSRNQSTGPSTVVQQEAVKEKADNKRLCVRRQSARFKSQQLEPTEDLFELEDAKFPCPQLDDPVAEDVPISLEDLPTRIEDQIGKSTSRCETPEVRRSSIGRPLRRAAEKVQSYKEIPVNIKMRRSE